MTKTIDWKAIRKTEFPVLDTMTFLDAACVSFAPQRAINAINLNSRDTSRGFYQ